MTVIKNALAERVNGILKNEFLLQTPKNLREATQMIKESIHIYNHERPHLALKYKNARCSASGVFNCLPKQDVKRQFHCQPSLGRVNLSSLVVSVRSL